jgi:hypothetical protein
MDWYHLTAAGLLMMKRGFWFVVGLVVTIILLPSLVLSNSIGEQGIYANRLRAEPYNLLGRKIAIGQVEIGDRLSSVMIKWQLGSLPIN